MQAPGLQYYDLKQPARQTFLAKTPTLIEVICFSIFV